MIAPGFDMDTGRLGDEDRLMLGCADCAMHDRDKGQCTHPREHMDIVGNALRCKQRMPAGK